MLTRDQDAGALDATARAGVVLPRAGVRLRRPFLTIVFVGLGGLFAGVTGPLLSTFVPLLVRDVLGEQRTAIGFVMAIDNVLLLILVPWMGAISDRAIARGGSRVPLVVAGFVLAAAGMALFPYATAMGIAGVLAGIVLVYTGINVQRSPFQALIADAVPSRYRSLATGSVTFQMCVGAIVFLMMGRVLGMRLAFLVAAGTVLGIAAAFALWVRENKPSGVEPAAIAAETTYRALADAIVSVVRGTMPALRTIFLVSILLQLTFQTFSTWFALHGTERFGVRPEDVTVGFIAWAIGGVIGALPAGFIGVRVGRRNSILLGFGAMFASLIALDRVTSVSLATPLLAVASAAWTFPMANLYPLFVEQVPWRQRGVLAAFYVLCMAGGAVGDPLNGAIFDLYGGYRPLFLIMATYTVLAFAVVLQLPRGVGEADTGA
jgi:MFS family permease